MKHNPPHFVYQYGNFTVKGNDLIGNINIPKQFYNQVMGLPIFDISLNDVKFIAIPGTYTFDRRGFNGVGNYILNVTMNN